MKLLTDLELLQEIQGRGYSTIYFTGFKKLYTVDELIEDEKECEANGSETFYSYLDWAAKTVYDEFGSMSAIIPEYLDEDIFTILTSGSCLYTNYMDNVPELCEEIKKYTGFDVEFSYIDTPTGTEEILTLVDNFEF